MTTPGLEASAVTRELVYLGLGANVGNREGNLRLALRLLEPLAQVQAVSSLYESEPWGPADQPPFYNAVARVTTGLEPPALLRHLKSVEHEMGRRPGERWGPRPIDLDILLYGERVLRTAELTIPHPGLVERPFVLVPLAELAPDVREPVTGRTIRALAEAVGSRGVGRVAGPEWAGKTRGASLRA